MSVNIYIIHELLYKLPFLNDNRTITAGPRKTIIPRDTSCPITCQLII